ncbi:MAG TPA: ABC transporter ATP-binding protein [Burkholderiales bacterium]|nr:ABC transporter ATP-binding protein [Burkholderiales bacterium]
MPEPVVEIDRLRFRWPAEHAPCLDITHFQIEGGERIFLHGPSWSGKSTLLALIGGVLTPETGTIKVLDQDLARMGAANRDRYRADHIGFIFQQFNLVPYLSVINNVLLPCRFSRRRRERAESGGRAAYDVAVGLLEHLDIAASLRTRPVVQLSVGQQQRVAAARALIGQPELLIADEPTSSLDAGRQTAFLNLLVGECERAGVTLLFVSHDMRLASNFTRVVALSSFNGAAVEAEAA